MRRTVEVPGLHGGEGLEARVEVEEEGAEADEAVWSGRVVGPEGVVGAARVRWLALEPEDLEDTVAWPGGGYGSVQRRSVETRSDASGHFSFRAAPSGELAYGSTVVVTHAELGPGGLDLAAGAEWPRGLEIQLALAPRLDVRVQAADGAPAVGARVRQVAFVDAAQGTPNFLRHLEAVAETDAEGRATLPAFPRGQAVWAEAASGRSRAWEGLGPAEVVLALGASCTLGGALALPDFSTWDPRYHGERRVVVSGLIGDHWRTLGVARDVAGSEWGPLVVPLPEVQRFRARLEGIPVIPVEQELAPPAPGAFGRIDLTTEIGQGLWLEVVDPARNPVVNATATAWWGHGAQLDERRRVVSSSRPNGRIYVGTFPDFPVRYQVRAPGFADFLGDVSVYEDATYEVVLQPAVQVTGRCLFRGEPVENFEILYSPSIVATRMRERFLERKDGRFELRGLGAGSWRVQALALGLPATPEQPVTLVAGESQELTLEFPEALHGAGQVVDAESGAGVAQATVQVLVAAGVEGSGGLWEPVPVAADGSFELVAFQEGENHLRVAAPGYSTTEVERRASGRELLDWGAIRLHRPQALVLRAVGGEDLGYPLQKLEVYDRDGRFGTHRFDADGVARIAEVPPGPCLLMVQYPDQTWSRLHLDLQPGVPWEFELEVAGGTRLDVLVTDAEGKAPDFDPGMMLDADEDGLRVVRSTVQQGLTPARVQGLRSEAVTVFVLNGNDIVATRRVELEPGATNFVQIRLGEAPLRARVVDGRREPLAGAWVVLRDATTGELVSAKDTDSAGWATLLGVPDEPLVADVTHASGERREVALDGRLREHELVLEASGALELVLRDGEVVLEGASVRLESVRGSGLAAARASDAAGRVRFEALGAGLYRFGCARADCWPATVEHLLSQGEVRTLTVELRRLCDVEFTLWRATGAKAAGVELALTNREHATEVGAWVQAGRVEAAAGMATDREGRLVLRGLPHGEYAWRVGDEAGVVTLAPGKNERELRLVSEVGG